MRKNGKGMRVFCLSAAFAVAAVLAHAQGLGTGGVNVLTWHNDTYRTGENLNEGTLTYNTINKTSFGQLCSVVLDGQVYGQPLVVTKVKIGTTTYDSVVYVVTQNDTLYAIKGTPPGGNQACQVLLSLPFLSAPTPPLPTNGQFPSQLYRHRRGEEMWTSIPGGQS